MFLLDKKFLNIYLGFYSWEQRKLGKITLYKNGKGNEGQQLNQGKYELINLNSISIDGGLKNSGRFVNVATETLKTNDLVMILSDVGHGSLLGRVAVIPLDNRYVLNQRVALLRPSSEAISGFLSPYINSKQNYFKNLGAGSSQLNISKGVVENFTVLIPIHKEQKQLSNFFQQMDNIITLHQRTQKTLEILITSTIEMIFSKNGGVLF